MMEGNMGTNTKRVRMDRSERKAALVEHAVKLGTKYGHNNITRVMVANAAKCSEGLVASYLGKTKTLRAFVKRELNKRGIAILSDEKQAAIGLKLWHKAGARGEPAVPAKKAATAKKPAAPAKATKKPAVTSSPASATTAAGGTKPKGKAVKKPTAGAGAAKPAAPVQPKAVAKKPAAPVKPPAAKKPTAGKAPAAVAKAGAAVAPKASAKPAKT